MIRNSPKTGRIVRSYDDFALALALALVNDGLADFSSRILGVVFNAFLIARGFR